MTWVIVTTDNDKTWEELSAKLTETVENSNIPVISDSKEVVKYLLEYTDDSYDTKKQHPDHKKDELYVVCT